MGYKIEYKSVAKPCAKIKHRSPVLILTVSLLVALLTRSVLKEWRTMLLQIFFPGDMTVTAASLQKMLSQLRDGTPFQEAFLVFCQQVIAG